MIRFIILSAGIMLFALNPLLANTYTVNTQTDYPVSGGVVTATGAIIGGAGAGLVSLRSAIIASNANPGPDIILFTNPIGSPDIYTLTIIASDNNAQGGDLDINGDLTITGNGKTETIIQMVPPGSGNCDCKVFGINQDGIYDGLTVSISALTIENGKNNATPGFFQETGGGVDIFLTGLGNDISFSDVKITNNTVLGSSGSYGGGVNIDSYDQTPGTALGTVTFTNCDITGNTADATGGGVNLFAEKHDVTFTNCTISNNQTLGPGGLGGSGGGMNIRHTYGGTVTITGSTISNNTGIGYGGGICTSYDQLTNISGTVISGNTVTNGTLTFSLGGGIYQSSSSATTLTNVTISGNHADAGAGAGGGGIFAGSGPISMTGGSITGNTSLEGAGVGVEDADITLTNLTVGTNIANVNGGGLLIRSTATGTTTLDGVTFSSNTADNDNNGTGDGGAIYRAAGTLVLNNTITVGSVGSGNSAVNGGGIANVGGDITKTAGLMTVIGNSAKNNGGGLYITSGTINLQKTAITNNTANSDNTGGGEGGGIYNNGGTLTLNYNRIALNIANANLSSNAFRHVSGTITNILNNWWGVNTPATVINGTSAFTPYLKLNNTPTAASICTNSSTGLTASFVLNSAGTNVLANIDRLIGLPITFNNATPAGSNITGAQATIQATGLATATFNSGSTSGAGGADATVDNGIASASITVDANPAPSISGGTSLCSGNSITLDAGVWSGYLWSTSASTQTISVNTAGTYSVTVTNASGCKGSASVTITGNPVPTPSISAHTDILCHGGNTGSATVTVPGGPSGYAYLWNNGQTAFTATGLTAGSYTVTVTNAQSCTATALAVISEPAALSAGISTHANVQCFGQNNGSATVTASGGTTGYTYLWNNGQTVSAATGLTVGSYTVTVTDANTCMTTALAVISQPGALSAGISTHTNVQCFGQNNGSATVTASGGTTGYTYLWNNGQTANVATGLTVGSYTVTVTDAHTCTATALAVINEPGAPLSAGISAHTNVQCFGQNNGSATVTAAGGTTNYTYLWNNGQTASTATGLTVGSYTVTVTDAHTCTVTVFAAITQAAAFSTGISTQANVQCFGQNNGSATVTASGGTTPYTYLWNNGQAANVATGLTVGSYIVTVTDAHTCSATALAVITQPAILTAGVTQTAVSCFGGSNSSATVSVSGGTTPYSYVWNNGQVAATATGLSVGTYSVTVTDANTCMTTASAVITQHDAITVDAGADQDLCQQSITVLTGNMPPPGSTGVWTLSSGPNAVYFYPFSFPNMAVVGIPPDEAPYVFRYTITTTYPGGSSCSNYDEMLVYNHHVPSTPYAGPDQNLCYKTTPLNVFYLAASIPIYGTGAWTQVPGGPSAVIANPSAPNTMVTYTTAGTYKFLWTVNNGPCLPYADTAVIKIFTPPAVYAGPDIEICGGSPTTITGSTATGDCMTLLWSTMGTGTFNDPAILHPVYSPSAADIAAGSVKLILEDTVGCCSPCGPAVVRDTMLLIFHPRPVPTASVVSNVSCNGYNNGSVTVTVTGGTTPYHYLWNDNLGQITATATGLTAGTYTVTVTDGHSCQGTSSATVTEPAVLTISATVTPVSCYTYIDGMINLSAGGGTSPYFYVWNTGSHTPAITGLSAGTYSVTVTDSQSCPAYGQWEITEPPAWSVFISGPGSACCNTSEVFEYDASVILTVPPNCCPNFDDGNPCVTYQWVVVGGTITGGWNTDQIFVHWNCCTQGTVTVTATRCDGCMLTTTIPVAVHLPPSPVVTGPASVDANSSTQYCALPAITGHTYSWSVIGGSYTSAPGSNCITVTWGPYPPCGCGKVIVCETDPITLCTGCDTLYVTIQPVGQNLQGYVRYDNSYNTGLNGVKIRLRDKATGLIAGTVWSGPDTNPPNEPGYYAFTNILPDTYALDASYDGTWGGNNATDALIVQLNVIGSYPLYYLRDTVADVNASMTITGLDALYIKLRTIGSISSYPAGDWKFTDTTFIFGTSATINLKGLCVGDVNGSYIPEGFKETNSLSVMEDGVMTVPVGEPFIYNINSSRNAELGAMTLFLGYDPARFEVIDVTSAYDGMKYIAGDGRIAIAWADTKPLKVNTDDMVLRLNMRVKDKISEPSRVFTIKAGSEFADISAIPYDNFDLKMSNVKSVGGANQFSIFNYPNPFRESTDIVYTIPEQGRVKLVITDIFGRIIHTMVDAVQQAGEYRVIVNPLDYGIKPGIYFYRFEARGQNTSYDYTGKMLLTR